MRVIFICWIILIYRCSVKASYFSHTNRIASKRKSIHHHRRSLQQSSTSNSVLTLTSKITASNGGTDSGFGNALAISNNRIVVGAYGYNNRTGAAYLFMDPNNPETGRSYSQMAILTANDGQYNNEFGSSVDIDGDIIVSGANEFNSGGPGAVYIFQILVDNNISQIAKITAQNGAAGDLFGGEVAVHGNFILVGAREVDKNGSLDVGSAYLFVNPSSDSNTPEWTQIMQFQPNDLTEYDWFGLSAAMEDQIAVIGTWGYDANAAYVFVPVDENDVYLSLWTQMAKLKGPTGSSFGFSVAVAGDTIVVGAPEYDNNNRNETGAVFVFTKIDGSSSSSSSTWTQTNVLLAADGAEGDRFGISVSISKDGSTIVVGAYLDDYNSTINITDSGAAYLFRNSNTTTTMTGWTQIGKYVAADLDAEDKLGSSISIENSIVAVSASGDNSYTGSVYILDTKNSSSQPTPPMTAPIDTTTAPTAEPVVPTTLQPTTSPPTKPTNSPATNPPTTNDGDENTNNPSSTPVTSSPMTGVPAASTPTSPNNDSTSSSNPNGNNNVIISATVVLGLVVVIDAL